MIQWSLKTQPRQLQPGVSITWFSLLWTGGLHPPNLFLHLNTRDDIADGGATHIAATVAALKATKPSLMVEVSVQLKKTLSSLLFVSLFYQ